MFLITNILNVVALKELENPGNVVFVTTNVQVLKCIYSIVSLFDKRVTSLYLFTELSTESDAELELLV